VQLSPVVSLLSWFGLVWFDCIMYTIILDPGLFDRMPEAVSFKKNQG
jgi:hypothetical protein